MTAWKGNRFDICIIDEFISTIPQGWLSYSDFSKRVADRTQSQSTRKARAMAKPTEWTELRFSRDLSSSLRPESLAYVKAKHFDGSLVVVSNNLWGDSCIDCSENNGRSSFDCNHIAGLKMLIAGGHPIPEVDDV